MNRSKTPSTPAEPAGTSADGREPQAVPRRPAVLIVDDSRVNRVLLRHLLSGQDAELHEAASGEAALAACAAREFALILLDVVMPGMDGFELARQLSQLSTCAGTPIIFVTAARHDELSRIEGYGSGAVDYIVKPINAVILQSKVRVFLELFRGRQQLQQALDTQRRLEEIARIQATHDSLTGLPNRKLFMDRLENLVERARRSGGRGALLYLDIDGFKPVNDRFGHHTGDELLKAIARRAAQSTRKTDTVARLGGDEFAVLLEEPIDPTAALAKAMRVAGSIKKPYWLADPASGKQRAVTIGVSIGIACLPDDARDADALVRAADTAMYEAKRLGKNQCRRAAAGARNDAGSRPQAARGVRAARG